MSIKSIIILYESYNSVIEDVFLTGERKFVEANPTQIHIHIYQWCIKSYIKKKENLMFSVISACHFGADQKRESHVRSYTS